MKDSLCALCGGELAERTVMLAREMNNQRPVLIRDVPARVCTKCGHRWLVQAVVKELEELIEGKRQPVAIEEIPVYSLR